MTRLVEVKKARGMRSADLARDAGIHPSTLSKLEKGHRTLRMNWARQLAPVLAVTPQDLFAEVGTPIPAQSHGEQLQRVIAMQRPRTAPPLPDPSGMPVTVPLLATRGYRGEREADFVIDIGADPIGMVRRSPSLADQPVDAVYLDGDNMQPWRRAGGPVYFHRNRPPAPGCHVVVLLNETDEEGGRLALVRRLERRTTEELVLHQYCPPKDITIKTRDVFAVYRVIELEEALGF